MASSRIRHGLRPEDIVGDRGLRIVFHQRDMFVGSCVEDDVGLILGEDAVHRGFVENVGDEVANLVGRPLAFDELLLHREDAEFGLVVDQEHLGIEIEELTAQFAADAACSAGDHDPAARDVALDRFHVEAIGFPPEQVRHGDIASGQLEATDHHLFDGRDNVDVNLGFGTFAENRAHDSTGDAAGDEQIAGFRLFTDCLPASRWVVDTDSRDQGRVPTGRL